MTKSSISSFEREREREREREKERDREREREREKERQRERAKMLQCLAFYFLKRNNTDIKSIYITMEKRSA